MKGLDELYADLEVDRVIPAVMAFRRYRVTQKAARSVGLRVVRRSLERSAELGGKIDVSFLTLEDELASLAYAATRLRHLAGVTATRHALNAPVEAWRNRGGALGRGRQPDGTWESEAGLVAIEYDAGGYDNDEVILKGASFDRLYDRQVWGAATPARVEKLRLLLEPYETAEVVLAPWWQW